MVLTGFLDFERDRGTGLSIDCYRRNLHLPDETQKKLPGRLRENFNDFAGHKVAKTDRTDGLKMIFDDGSWILMRPSGTEPVARIYTEASKLAAAEKLAEDAQAWITQ